MGDVVGLSVTLRHRLHCTQPTASLDPIVQPEDVRCEPGSGARILARISQTPAVRSALGWRERHKQIEPAAFFFGGVLWDAATLRRIDAVVDNVLLGMYLIVLAVLITGAVLVQADRTTNRLLIKHREALPAAIQFLMGALFSAYVIFYFQSASWTSTSAFVVLLLGLLIANEFVHRRLFNVYLLFALYYLAAFSFFVFFVPVVTKTMNYAAYVAGGLLSAALVAALLHFLWRRGVFEQHRQVFYSIGIVALLFTTLNVFYLQNWIPPVPLALRHAGIYHEVERDGNVFELRYEKGPWYKFWSDDDRVFRYSEGDAVHCFAAVFAPTKLRTALFHEWRYYDEALGKWMTTDRMRYEIEGHRDGGYRWFSRKRNVKPGRWMVDIRTTRGRTVGRVRFDVVRTGSVPREFETLRYE